MATAKSAPAEPKAAKPKTGKPPAAQSEAEKPAKAPKAAAPAKAEPKAKAAAPKAQASGARLKITQTGSKIARRHDQEATLIGLGLNKRHRSKVLQDTPEIRGMIRKVAHLVIVETVS